MNQPNFSPMSGKVGHSNEPSFVCLAHFLIKFAASDIFATGLDFYAGFCDFVIFQSKRRSKIRPAAAIKTGLIYSSPAPSFTCMLRLIAGMTFLFLTDFTQILINFWFKPGNTKSINSETGKCNRV
ncbi:hypothetical protein ACO0LF_14915 [Undibacterium sp. Di27W]|uniref:hypothetical protein n=1 Tax=Undibacterium sp. Di27W TaxID=3413036 RepID=UPI003BF0FD87